MLAMQICRFRWGATLAAYIAIVMTTWIAVDTLTYFFLPARLVRGVPAYRFFETQFYIRKSSTRGFDLSQNASGFISVDGNILPIFSNSLGCFDKNGAEAFKNGYVYFAGDSFTWGFCPLRNQVCN